MGFPLNTLLYLFWLSIVRGKIVWVSNVARSNVRRPNVPRSNGGGQMSFCTTSDFDREYLRNEATYPKSEDIRTRAIPPATCREAGVITWV